MYDTAAVRSRLIEDARALEAAAAAAPDDGRARFLGLAAEAVRTAELLVDQAAEGIVPGDWPVDTLTQAAWLLVRAAYENRVDGVLARELAPLRRILETRGLVCDPGTAETLPPDQPDQEPRDVRGDATDRVPAPGHGDLRADDPWAHERTETLLGYASGEKHFRPGTPLTRAEEALLDEGLLHYAHKDEGGFAIGLSSQGWQALAGSGTPPRQAA
ncbi:MAG TPA: hypothetical protein VEY95_05090 [Azospirillaceae bacterium]|nr:hypothetical protein [Azospirillaceae bacterium]